jgi:hypothetical protein
VPKGVCSGSGEGFDDEIVSGFGVDIDNLGFASIITEHTLPAH